MTHRRPTAPFRSLLLSLAVAGTAALRAQELTDAERQALTLRAQGQPVTATATLLRAALFAATEPLDDTAAARLEAWATLASRVGRATADRVASTALDGLCQSAAAAANPLLADRLAIAALELAETFPDRDAARRATALGFLTGGFLLGPFANERGSGFATALPPETNVDLDAELPGKRRPVRWRALPARTVSPQLPLAAIVHPHEQSLVYLAHAVVADEATTAVLELGSTGAFVVWCNGQQLAARDVERPFAYDQDAVEVPLRAGPNLLLFKFGHQEGDAFTVAARLRGRDGARLAGVSVRNDPAVLREAAAVKAAAPTSPAATPRLGGRSTWAIGAAQGADALRLAWLWRARDADGDRDRRDARAAAAATAALPDVADAWLVLAQCQLRHGRSAADRDDNERRRALEQALAVAPGHVEALIQLGSLLRDGSALWRQARVLADAALRTNPQAQGAILLRLATLRDEGRNEEADAELLAAAVQAARPELWRLAAAHLAERAPKLALRYRRHVLAVSTAEGDWLAEHQQALRARTKPAADLSEPWRIDPFAARLHRQQADLLLANGDARGAIAVLERWLTVAPDDAGAMVALAAAWARRRGDDPTATETQLDLLREALAVEPNRRDDERYAEYLATAARGGAAATAFHTPYEVDAAALLRGDASPPADAAAAGDPLHWLLRQQVVRANANGTTNVYRHDIVRILSADGARAMAQYTLPAYGGEQRARLSACTVFRADGSVQRPALQGARVRLPDLRVGDVVAVAGRVDDLQPSFFGDYFGLEHHFGSPEGSPVARDELIVLAATGRDYHVQAVQGAPEPERTTLADGTLQLRVAMRDLPRDRGEIRRPARKERDPTLRITTYADWDRFAAWWWNLIKNQLEVSPAMQRTVAERTAGLATTEAKIAALYHFVTTDVRYEAWEFGVHGYKPYSTAIIHERRHGDCKDKALLLCALLGEIGVPCRPVLIFADDLRSRDDLALPLVQHFNHCIAWLPPHEGRPGRFLDGTATWHPSDTLPEMDQGAKVLVVDRGKAELLEVPTTTPAANADVTTWTIELAADGSATLRQEQRPTGNTAVALRAELATEPARLRESAERGLVRRFGAATLRSVEPSAPGDPEAQVSLVVTATLPELGQKSQDRWQLPGAFDDGDLLALAAEGERRQPLLLGVPSGRDHSLTYRLPPGYRPGELPPPTQLDAPFGSFHMEWRRDGDRVVVRRQLALTTPRVEPAQYGAFRDFVTAIKAADAQLLLLQAEGGR